MIHHGKTVAERKVAIITGGSYGMGQTIAELFAEEGAAVMITARGREKLDAVKVSFEQYVAFLSCCKCGVTLFMAQVEDGRQI